MKARRYWVFVPIVAAFILVLVFASVAGPEQVSAARALWDARRFTRYEMQVVYYDNHNNSPCDQTLVVDGEQVVEVRLSSGCDMPIEGIEYPTVTDILNYLQAKTDEYANGSVCAPSGCECDGPMGVVAKYDPRAGYPMRAEVRVLYETQQFITTSRVNCSYAVSPLFFSIEIRRLIPQ